jgi:D-alanyl-D-alanine carboxypeptidase (penicillin-binding protein 5/6)
MNKVAIEYGLKNTKFSNPHGLANKLNKSTCNDIAILTCKGLKMPEFAKIVQTKCYTCYYKLKEPENKSSEEFVNEWINTNKLLDKGFLGVKTGITNAAGACLSSLY